jgi:RNA polymerase sigma factor (sigma-70 family)
VEQAETNELWLRFKSGDYDALSKLYNLHVHDLFSYGLKIHGDEFLVKDCIQEVFIRLIVKRRTLELTSGISVYLFKSLRNKLLEELRTRNRRTDITNSIISGDTNHEISVEQTIIHSEEEQSRARNMDAALNTLSDYQKEAIFLKYSQGLEYEKIAELLDIDSASARTLIYRSLKKVKEAIFNKNQVLLLFFGAI